MLKRIAQASAWFMAYFMLQNVISIVLAVVKIASSPDLLNAFKDPAKMNDVLTDVLTQTVVPALIISAVCYILIYLVHRKIVHKKLDLCTLDWQKAIFFVGIGGVMNVATNITVSLIAAFMPKSWLDALTSSTDMVSTGQPFWLLLLGTGLLVPIMEELTFRYGMFKTLAQRNVAVAYIASSIIFGLMHGNPIQMVYATLLGLLLAYVYTKTENIWYPIILHAVNNTSSLLQETFPSTLMYIGVIAGGGAVIALISYFACPRVRTMFNKKTPTPAPLE